MIRVESPGAFTTVQDLGRPGYGPLGVSAAGAADPIALRIGNRLAGNPPGAAALEMTLVGGAFLFEEAAVVALAGSDFSASIDGLPVEVWCSYELRAGSVLRAGATRSGARSYLCVRGGIDVPLVLGSASTHVRSGLGGFHGRALRKGDVLAVGNFAGARPGAALRPEAPVPLAPRKLLRITWGPQRDWFSEACAQALVEAEFAVTEQADRMGLRLQGPPIEAASSAHMITEGVSLGAIQAPPGGQPIILFVDQQTTGGYPVIANVIAADLPSLGQLRPRDRIRFAAVPLEEAAVLIAEQERLLDSGELFY